MSKKVIRRERCPECAKRGEDTSGDNLAIYEDNSDYCFKCAQPSGRGKTNNNLISEVIDIPVRGLSKKTCEKYNIECGLYTGFLGQGTKKKYFVEEPIYVFKMIESNEVYCKKIRTVSDRGQCTQLGDTKNKKFFGQSNFNPNKKLPIIITEGELDAASIYEATGYPAVSITRGAAAASNQIAANIDWLAKWKYVTLCFDNDEAGIEATRKCTPHFEPGTVRVAKLPLKDANDMVVLGRGAELKSILWNAEVVRPKTIVSVSELRDKILKQPEMGLEWPWPQLTEVTRGFRTKEIYVVAAASGTGKTELIKEMVFHLLDKGMTVGMFSFEQDPTSTMQRLIGNKVGHKLHDPANSWWDVEKIDEQIAHFDNKIYLYDNRGAMTWDDIAVNIRYMVKCFGIKCVVLDNLTAMCACPVVDGQRLRDFDYISHVIGNLFSLAHELDVTFMIVAHLAKDKIGRQAYVTTSPKNPSSYYSMTAGDMDKAINKPGMEWDSGRIPALGNIAGSDSISRLADYVFGLARNRVSEDYAEHVKLKIKVLKSGRIDSGMEGKIFNLYYDSKLGKLVTSLDFINGGTIEEVENDS